MPIPKIDAIIGCLDALEIVHGLMLDERVLRDDLIDRIGGSGVAESA